MTDKELLELAAKANWPVSDEVSFRFSEADDEIIFIDADNQDHNGRDREFVWNPLTDDGDALRLAVKLKLGMVFTGQLVIIGTKKKALADEMAEDYKYAIVRAAAEIGKTL